MTAPMMRSRQRGNPCRVPGHGSRCEVSAERQSVTRAQEKREWQADTGFCCTSSWLWWRTNPVAWEQDNHPPLLFDTKDVA